MKKIHLNVEYFNKLQKFPLLPWPPKQPKKKNPLTPSGPWLISFTYWPAKFS